MTVEELARSAGISRRTAYRAVEHGAVDSVRLRRNGAIRVPAGEVGRILRDRRRLAQLREDDDG